MMETGKPSFIQNYLIYFAWIVSVVATSGSLYFSEVLGFIPCDLCWYQRIFMYPLSVILGIAAYYNEKSLKKYVLPLSIIGGSISLYHYMLQKIPGFVEIKPCTQGVPCNVDYIDWLGFITIPFLALTAFLLIIMCMLLLKPSNSQNNEN
ncbi:disulfide bond formation protein B [Paenibacillus sp. JMULE4]|uniref:Disulfide bond formation protein B n=1 Tax=Paenibacillus validus TaxID=44253 RepID=A0A7X2ZDX4_9BACL|nr:MULTISPECIES: disulfide oxidoreductase [Paenibacillus]MUG73038.1 disulfide bond formation protein B [Paenibacillus validus]NTZ19493.1 disulfide bond formation protein B [Paenibacillus sp. JMULE4]